MKKMDVSGCESLVTYVKFRVDGDSYQREALISYRKNMTTYVKFRVDGDSYQGEALISCNIFIGYRIQNSFMTKFPSST